MSNSIESKYSNARVHGGSGYEFQKHCALYILLDEYKALQDKDYCIYFEHADDFVYCFFNDKLLEEVRSYQAKKKDKAWSKSDLKEILVKLCHTGVIIKQDNGYTRSSKYCQSETFITNKPITINDIKVGSDNEELLVKNAPKNVQDYIKDIIVTDVKSKIFESWKESGRISKEATYNNWSSQNNEKEKNDFKNEVEEHPAPKEINNLRLQFIDFPDKQSSQKEQIIGRLTLLFNDKIYDKSAAVDTLLSLFTKSASTFNQGEVISFINKEKQITSNDINTCLKILTSESKAYNLWHEKANELCRQLQIPINEKKIFKEELHNSFDYFKDTTKIEHHKIFGMAKSMFDSGDYFSEQDLVNDVFSQYTKQYQSRLSNTAIKAICFAAAFQLQN